MRRFCAQLQMSCVHGRADSKFDLCPRTLGINHHLQAARRCLFTQGRSSTHESSDAGHAAHVRACRIYAYALSTTRPMGCRGAWIRSVLAHRTTLREFLTKDATRPQLKIADWKRTGRGRGRGRRVILVRIWGCVDARPLWQFCAQLGMFLRRHLYGDHNTYARFETLLLLRGRASRTSQVCDGEHGARRGRRRKGREGRGGHQMDTLLRPRRLCLWRGRLAAGTSPVLGPWKTLQPPSVSAAPTVMIAGGMGGRGCTDCEGLRGIRWY